MTLFDNIIAWLVIFLLLLGCANDNDGGSTKSEWGSDSDCYEDTATEKGAGHGDDTSVSATADEDAGASSPWPNGKYIPIEQVYERLVSDDPDMLLINVVDEEFYDLGHIDGSLKIPWDSLEANLERVDSARHIVIYCRRGVRSESAYTTLIDNGFSLVWVMEGGIEEWIAAGYPTVP